MAKHRHRSFRILTGPLAGTTHLGVYIGHQEYLDQIKIEKLEYEDINRLIQRQTALGRYEGIWIYDRAMPFYRPLPTPGAGGVQPRIEVTKEGVSYEDVYVDLCVPYDRFNNEISVGDELYVASSNEVRLTVVTRIAEKPAYTSYSYNRKITVRDTVENQTLVINDPVRTIKKT